MLYIDINVLQKWALKDEITSPLVVWNLLTRSKHLKKKKKTEFITEWEAITKGRLLDTGTENK